MQISSSKQLSAYLQNYTFRENLEKFFPISSKQTTIVETIRIENKEISRYTNEFWTSKQRQASSIHEISYRACFKPQLPRFFINLLTKPKDTVYDPFGGRGTTVIEAGLLKRNIISNDINPLSKILTYPRFFIPTYEEIKERFKSIPFEKNLHADIDLSMFYHPNTESEIVSLKEYLLNKSTNRKSDEIDNWIQMIATNRLTGHSKGFFSVYTLPPNQAVTQESQKKINKKRNQIPEYRDVKKLILKKSKSLMRNLSEKQIKNLYEIGAKGLILTEDARNTSEIQDDSVQLSVTSPPFLDVVQYSKDNWLRCWFNGINEKEIEKTITMTKKIDDWSKVMFDVFSELYRVTKPGGWLAFEVGEVRKRTIKLDEYIVPLGLANNFICEGIIVNLQEFTKTSNIWGIDNNTLGTNTNRIVLFRKNN